MAMYSVHKLLPAARALRLVRAIAALRLLRAIAARPLTALTSPMSTSAIGTL